MRELAPDPRPHPPDRPLASDCCEGGCAHCVFELYHDALARYERELAAWQARQVGPGA